MDGWLLFSANFFHQKTDRESGFLHESNFYDHNHECTSKFLCLQSREKELSQSQSERIMKNYMVFNDSIQKLFTICQRLIFNITHKLMTTVDP